MTTENQKLAQEQIKLMADAIKEMPPLDWILISPSGKVWQGQPEYLLQVLAARTTTGAQHDN